MQITQTPLDMAVATAPVTLYHADCLAALAQLLPASIQTACIDPPYNTGNQQAKYAHSHLLRRKRWSNFHAPWDTFSDYPALVRRWVAALKRVLVPTGTVWVCGSHHSIPAWDVALRQAGFWIIQWVQWCIPNAMPNVAMTQMASSNQTIIWARKGKRHYYNKEAARQLNGGKNLRDYWEIPNDCVTGRTWKHPSKKPVPLIERQIRLSTPTGAPVLDCFAGSGTTGVAARRLGHPCVLVEQSTAYVAQIQQRLHLGHEEVITLCP